MLSYEERSRRFNSYWGHENLRKKYTFFLKNEVVITCGFQHFYNLVCINICRPTGLRIGNTRVLIHGNVVDDSVEATCGGWGKVDMLVHDQYTFPCSSILVERKSVKFVVIGSYPIEGANQKLNN